jgi:hypothetical protein
MEDTPLLSRRRPTRRCVRWSVVTGWDVVRAATTMCLAPTPAALADRPSRQPVVAHKSCESIQVGVSGNTVAQSQETQAQCCNVCDSVGMGVC